MQESSQQNGERLLRLKVSKAGSTRKTLESFFTLVTRLNVVVTAAKNAKELAPPVIQYLLEKLI